MRRWPPARMAVHMSTPAVSVIVPMRNATEHVLEQVAALANQSAAGVDFEVIWVDNGSDGRNASSSSPSRSAATSACVWSRRPRCGRRTSLETGGSARPGGPAAVLRRRRRRRRALGAFDGNGARRAWISSAGALKATSDEPPAVPSDPVLGFLPAAPTANLAIRRTTFDALGGFDELDSPRRRHSAVLAALKCRASGSDTRLRAWCFIGGERPNGAA